MNIERYIVTVVDTGDSCDSKARVLGAFNTYDEAKNYVESDIKDTVDTYTGLNPDDPSIISDFDKMTLEREYGAFTSFWNIEKQIIILTDDEINRLENKEN